jgi:mycothiol system anti-sigma-R factor
MVTPATSAESSCDAVRALSFATCDGELSADECVAIDAHVHRCGGCRSSFTADAVFLRSVRAACTLDSAPPSLQERIEQLLQRRATENAST